MPQPDFAGPDAALSPSASPFRVTAIGSCRVASPLRQVRPDAGFELNQTGIYGYCHSSREALQQLRILQGDGDLPNAVLPLVAPSLGGAGLGRRPHVPSDFYVIELCSAKELTIDGTSVQLNYLTRHFEHFFDDRDRARSFWRLARKGEPDTLLAWLEDQDPYWALSPEDRRLLAGTRLSMTTEEGLRRDIAEIARRVPALLFVTHFQARRHDGAHLKARSEFISLARSVLKAMDMPFFDPSDYVEAYGQAAALDDAAQSLSHYAPGFEAFLSDHWVRRYIQPAALAAREAENLPAAIQA